MTILVCLAFHTGCGREPSETNVADSVASFEIPDNGLERARQLIASREFDAAREELEKYLQDHPDDPVALEMAGDGAMQGKQFDAAIAYYAAAASATDQPTQGLWFKWAGATIKAERPFDTIAVLTDAVDDYPDSLEIRQNLASFLARVGMQLEAAEHFQWLVQRKHGSQSVLLILADLTLPQTFDETCEAALRRNPEDLRPVFSLAQRHVSESNWEEVKKALVPVVEQHPDFLPAQALYGRALVELGEPTSVERWSQSLPKEIEAYTQYWLAAGTWAAQQGSMDQAARAYWSAVRLNENDPEALQGLSIALTKLGRTKEAAIAVRRTESIAALRSHLQTLVTWDFESQEAVVDLALKLHELGRVWEATSWLMIGYSMQQHLDPRFDRTFREIRGELTGSTPWQLPEQMVSTKMDLASFPKVAWGRSTETVAPRITESSNGVLRFQDESAARSLIHLCDIGKSDGEESGLMIYQSGAGGAGVIDFDLDGWPDTYLTVMNGAPNHNDSLPNRLHRNLSGSFRDVTESSSLIDHGYSQGMSVGDYNADGWPDIYVANIGENRLYRNNGDGTFSDVTESCDLRGAGWTTSVAIADLNEDGHADIYEVGYCRGEDPLNLQCVVESIDEARSCNPLAFDAEPDRVWTGNGDGTFSDATHWLGSHDPGRGFGLVIGNLDPRPGLETYIANDMTANHYWARSVDASEFGLSDQAAICGLAFNRRSIAQASMGIAAADADNDGDVDFLLTHFADDHNTYYQQDGPGIWSDESQAAGFAESSKPMLAYGTQWIDVDNDGSLEAFIANGDIDDFQFAGRSFRQPAQLLQQTTRGRWQVMQPDALGNYFAKQRLARSVATLDADRDGRSDLIVTHLFDPVALLINRSETTGKQTRFFLRSRSTHRDSIGASVRFTIDDRVFEQQLLAGNGFQCVNEACIVFGMSDAETHENVQAIWPDGTAEPLGDLAAGGDYMVVQGIGAFPLGI